MGEKRQDRPRSLFGDDDVRYSVDTVDERWGREMSRRKRLAAKIVLPVALTLICVWLVTAKKYEYFPFQKPMEMPPSIEELEARKPKDKPEPIEKMGNEEAKLSFCVTFPEKEGKIPDNFLAILHEATDTKPSQIYAEIWAEKDAPEWLKQSMSPGSKFAIGINGAPVFEPVETESKLINIINDCFSNIYKDDKLVINPATYGLKQPTEEELRQRSEKRIKREQEENFTLPSLKFER